MFHKKAQGSRQHFVSLCKLNGADFYALYDASVVGRKRLLGIAYMCWTHTSCAYMADLP